jgi:hypothetical protein
MLLYFRAKRRRTIDWVREPACDAAQSGRQKVVGSDEVVGFPQTRRRELPQLGAVLALAVRGRRAVGRWTSVGCWHTLVVMMSEGGPVRNIPICPNHSIFAPEDGEQGRSAGTHLARLVRMSIAPPLRPDLFPGVTPPGAEG